MVQCSRPFSTVAERHLLGPLDHLVPLFIPVAVVFVYRQPSGRTTASPPLLPLPRLKAALSLLLDGYPHLTGRLHVDEVGQRREVRRMGSGALLVEAVCPAPLAAFTVGGEGDSRLDVTGLPDGGNALLAPYESSAAALTSSPLLTVCHCSFACGGLSLGVRLPHCLCDADGFFQLANDLLHIVRRLSVAVPASGAASLPQAPHTASHLAHLLHHATKEERSTALLLRPSLYRLQTEESPSSDAALTAGAVTVPVLGRVLRFSAGELRRLKSQANESTVGGGCWVSTFDALSAHLYQRVHIARLHFAQLQGADPALLSTDFLTPVNWRGTNRLHLPPRYFANAVLCTFFTLPSEQLATAPLSQIAKAVHNSVHSLTPQQAADTVQWMAVQPDQSRVKQDFRYANGGFMVSQWNKLPMYAGMALGQDKAGQLFFPALVAPPFTPISTLDGLAYILATESSVMEVDDAALDVSLTLSAPLWAILERDEFFRRFKSE